MFKLFDQTNLPSRPVEASSDGLKLLLLAIQSEGSDPYLNEKTETIQLPPISSLAPGPVGLVGDCPTEAWRVHIPSQLRDAAVPPLPNVVTSSSGGSGHKRCHQCGATETPKWRRGQSEGHSGVRLCNACGIRSKRLMRRKVPKHSSDRLEKKELRRAFLQERKVRSPAFIHHPYPHEPTVIPMVLSSFS